MKILKTLFGFCMIALLSGAALADDWAGKITEQQGTVTINRGAAHLAGKIGVGILAGDEIVTAPSSRVKIFFKDQSIITLAEKSRFKVEALEYNPGVNRKSIFNLVSGKAKAVIGGWFSNTPEQNYQIKALSTVAGVRGTTLTAEVQGEGGNVRAVFTGVSGTVTIWNVDHPDQKISLPAGYFLSILAGAMPGVPLPISNEQLEQYLIQFLITSDGRGDRSNFIFDIWQLNLNGSSGGSGEDFHPNLGDNLEINHSSIFNPSELILQEPPGFTVINIRPILGGG